jgi:hypothetical protein
MLKLPGMGSAWGVKGPAGESLLATPILQLICCRFVVG